MRLIFGYVDFGAGHHHRDRTLAQVQQNLATGTGQPRTSIWRDGSATLATMDFGTDIAIGDLPGAGHLRIAADVRLDVALGSGEDAAEFARYVLERGGEAALGPVLGDFASARWDGQSGVLTLARDGFGIRPLAYVYRPGRFVAFASLPRALRAAGLDDAPVDEAVLLGRCVRRCVPNTGVGGIFMVPPGHWVRFSAGGSEASPFWQLDRALGGTLDMPEEAAITRLRDLIAEAVRCRLPKSGPVGTHLSGGLDSSALTVLAARTLRARGDRVHAFTHLERPRNDFPAPADEELARHVLTQEGDILWTPLHFPPPRGEEHLLCPETAIPVFEDQIDTRTSAAAAASGVSLVLSGFGGNEAASDRGHGAVPELAFSGQWRRLARELRGRWRDGEPARNIVARRILPYLLPETAYTRVMKLFGRSIPVMATQSLTSLLTPEGRNILKGAPPALWNRTADTRENRYRTLTYTHIAETTLHLADCGARHGIAYAFPLLDRRVVEFAFTLPGHLLYRDGVKRYAFRAAMAGILPEPVRSNDTNPEYRPGFAMDLLAERDLLLARLARYRQSERVSRLIDLDKVEARLRAIPSADALMALMQSGDPRYMDVRSDFIIAARMLDHAGHMARLEARPSA